MLALWSAIAVLAVIALLGWALAWYNRRQLAALQQRLEQLEKSLRSELAMANSAAIGIGQRVISAEKKINNLLKREEPQADDGSLPYSQPAALLEQGMDAQQLAERCGLTEAEAQLLAILKQNKPQDSSLN
mgnify:CR=1 FL=1